MQQFVGETTRRSEQLGRFVAEIEAAIEKAKRLGLEVTSYLLTLSAADVREAYVVQLYDEGPPRSPRRSRRQKELAAGL